MTTDLNWFGVIASTIGLLSAIATSFMVISACCFSRSLTKLGDANLKQTKFFLDIIKCMSGCDFVYGVVMGSEYLSVASPSTFYHLNGGLSNGLCVFKAFVIQFCSMASVSWNFILGIVLLRSISKYFQAPLNVVGSHIMYYHIFVWSVALIATLIPLFSGVFGYVNNIDGKEFECWIDVNIYQLYEYGPIGFFLFCAILLLLYCMFLHYCAHKPMTALTKRIIYFTIVFVIVWIFPFIDRMYSIVKPHMQQKQTNVSCLRS